MNRLAWLLLPLALAPRAAEALPSFRQLTGMPCTACHTTAFGPSLTPEGEAFKLLGYALGERRDALPLNALAVASFTRTLDDQPPGAATAGFEENDNVALDEVSLVYAGPVAPKFGALAEVRYDGIAHEGRWGNLDLRYADGRKVGVSDFLIWGVSLNNSPTVQDLWNTSPAWTFPFVQSGVAPQPAAAPIIERRLAYEVYGLSGYTLVSDYLYLELGGYRSLTGDVRDAVNAHGLDRIDGIASYWRVAAVVQEDPHALRFGAFGMTTPLFPGGVRSAGHDQYVDATYDATYSYRAERSHFKLQLAYTQEAQELDASAALGAAQNAYNLLHTYYATGILALQQALTLTAGGFAVEGTADAGLYAAAPVRGSANHEPDSGGAIVEIAYGTSGRPVTAFSLNYRIGLQLTHYDRFNGAHSDYDGAGRDAADNDTLFGYVWIAI